MDAIFSAGGLVRRRVRSRSAARPQRVEPLELEPAPKLVPRVAANGVAWFPVPAWEKLPWLWHGFTTRRAGVSTKYLRDATSRTGELNAGYMSSDENANVAQNRRLLAEAATGDAETPFVSLRQFHSNLVRRVDATSGEARHKGDGMIAADAGMLLGIETADCIPVLVADTRQRVIGAFHAGWRGTVKRIVEEGVGRMRLEFGSRAADLTAAIGPAIGVCCYAVGDEVLAEFEAQFSYARELLREVYDSDPIRTKYPLLFMTQRAPGHSPIGPSLHLDLAEANRRQLLDAGLAPGAIFVLGACTSCRQDLFFSHRGAEGRAGRMLSFIGVRDETRGRGRR